jgi:hypothetical protein
MRFLWFLVACSGPVDAPDVVDSGGDEVVDSGVGDTGDPFDVDTGGFDWDALNGVRPDEPIGMPAFSALNYDGSARGPGDLLDHPTAMWFYPLAESFG